MDSLHKIHSKIFSSFFITLIVGIICSADARAAISISVPATDDDGSFTVSWTGMNARFELYENGVSIAGGTYTAHSITGRPAGTYTYIVYNYCTPPSGGWPVQCGSSSGTVVVGPRSSSSKSSSAISSSFSSQVLQSSRSSSVLSNTSSSVSSQLLQSSSKSSLIATSSSSSSSSSNKSSSPSSAKSSSSSSVFSFSYYATTPTLSGDYSIHWSGARTYVILYEKVNGINEYKINITGSGANSYSVTGKLPGVYDYILQECESGPSGGCRDNALRVIVSASNNSSAGSSSKSSSSSSSISSMSSSSISSASGCDLSGSATGIFVYRATTPNTNGDYDIEWCNARSYVILYELINGQQTYITNLTGSIKYSVPIKGKIPGVYDYLLQECLAGPSVVCTSNNYLKVTVPGNSLSSASSNVSVSYSSVTSATSSSVTSNSSSFQSVQSSKNSSSSSSLKIADLSGEGQSFLQEMAGATPLNPLNDIIGEPGFNGFLRGTQSVGADGSFNYSMPLAIPVGINAVQPKLQLIYNSNTKNGLMGWGWSLNGLSVISRCNANMIRDGYISGIQAGNNYKYCLDGQRLVEVANGEYRTESESFLRIKRTNNYWIVTNNAGLESRYGFYPNNILEDDQNQAYAWYLDQQKDIAGNSWSVSYTKLNDNGVKSHYPASISYTQTLLGGPMHTVAFFYQDRDDISLKYIAGVRHKVAKRISRIELRTANTPIYSYVFDYQQAGQTYHGKSYSDPAKTSRLASIKQCFASSLTNCSMPVEFDWNLQTEQNYLFTPSNIALAQNAAASLPLDINGDGKVETYTPRLGTVENGDLVEQIRYKKNTSNLSLPPIESKRVLTPSYKVVDVNGDGRDDIVKEFKTIQGLEVYLSNGTSINATPEPAYSMPKEALSYPAILTWDLYVYGGPTEIYQDLDPDRVAYNTAFVDVNGDKLPDLVRYPYDCFGPYMYCRVRDVPGDTVKVAKDISVAINTGEGFGPFNVWYGNWTGVLPTCGSCEMTTLKLNFVDLNGDSAIDFLATAVFPDLTQHAIAGYNNGLGAIGGAFSVESIGVNSARDQLMGDFNGDGLIDIAKMPMREARENAPVLSSTFIAINLGIGKPVSAVDPLNAFKGFAGVVYAQNNTPLLKFCGNSRNYSFTVKDSCYRTVKDFNNDGLDDIIEWGERVTYTCKDGTPLVNENSCPGNREQIITDAEAHVYLSLGGAKDKSIDFSAPIIYRNFAIDSLVAGLKRKPYGFDDFNMDGAFEDDSRLQNNVTVNRIEAVVEYDRKVSVKYIPLSSDKIYKVIPANQLQEDFTGFIQNPQIMGKRFGVKLLEVSNGAGGTNSVDYTFSGAKNHSAYGDLGFASVEKIEKVDGKAPIKTISTYYQAATDKYKLAGRLKREVTYTLNSDGSNGTLLSDTRNQWKVRVYADDVDAPYKSPHYFAYLYHSSNQSWDTDGTLIAEALTQNRPDATTSCTTINSASPSIVLVDQGSANDKDYNADGVLLSSQTAICDQSNSSAAVQIKTLENLDITNKGNARALVQKRKQSAWIGSSINAYIPSAANVRTQSFGYNNLGQLERQIIEPDASAVSALKLTTTYSYNSFGSINSVIESWDDVVNDGLAVSDRTTLIAETYDTLGVRKLVITKPLGLIETTEFHPVWGVPVKYTDVNGLVTQTSYDYLGRVDTISYADNTNSKLDYRRCSNCTSIFPAAAWYEQSKTTGSAAIRTYYDGLNRVVGTRTTGLNGTFVYTAQTYDSAGKQYQTSAPFYDGESRKNITRFYDSLGRVSSVSYPDNTSETYNYAGLTHTTTNRLNQTQTRYLNAAGWVMQSRDNTNTPVDFTYWSWGDLKTSQVNNDPKTLVSIVYDGLGRKTEMTDPNTGKTSYTYNALGLVATQTDAKNQRTCFAYDALGRQVKRIDKATSSCTGTTQNWYYDTSTNGKGQLASLSGVSTDGSSYSESYSYTNTGLPAATSYSIGLNSYSITQHYDSYSRPLGVTYPTGYVVANRYNNYGHLNEIIDSANTRVWKADDADALGNLKQFTLGNGVVTNQTYDVNNNRIETIRAVKGSLVIQDQRYQFDAIGNLNSREDRKNSITQNFCYDGLNRLKAARFNGCNGAANDYSYDPLGNLTVKEGITGTMGYGTAGSNVAGPHAITSANGWSYKYDAIGNLETATKAGEQTRTVQYSPFNTPTSITQGSKFSTIVYGPNQDRIKHSDSNGRLTNYVGGIYEEVTKDGITQKIHYVGDIALFISKGDNTSATYGYEYQHRDHIGSIVALSKGTVTSALDVQWQANGAWGERRYQQWNGPLDNLLIPTSTARGFTDHEHLDAVGLIHMNGRVYDPELGRFMSADPFVQAPFNSQSYNRYSYVFNNPLSFTDPSGYICGSVTVYDISGKELSRSSNNEAMTLCGRDAENFAFDWQNQQERQNNWSYTIQNFQVSYSSLNSQFNGINSTGLAVPIEGNPFGGAVCGIVGLCLGDSVESAADIGAAERVVGKHAMMAATIVGMVVGPAKARVVVAGSKPVAYSVAMEVTIAKQGVGTRPSHFKDANTQLNKAIESDPEFAKIMSSLGISVPTKLGTSPANWTWHHVPNQPGVLQLVPKIQHAGSSHQSLLHPNGKGGFYKWGSQY